MGWTVCAGVGRCSFAWHVHWGICPNFFLLITGNEFFYRPPTRFTCICKASSLTGNTIMLTKMPSSTPPPPPPCSCRRRWSPELNCDTPHQDRSTSRPVIDRKCTSWGALILRRVRRALRRSTYHGTGDCELFFWMGSGYCNIFVRFEYCASPLWPFDLFPSPNIEENSCGANYPTANYPSPAAGARRKRSLSPHHVPNKAHHHLRWRGAAVTTYHG